MKILSVNFINKTIQILLVLLFIINLGASFYAPLLSVYITNYIIGATLATVGVSVALYAIIKSVFQVLVAKKLDGRPGEKDDFFMLLFGLIIGTIHSFSFLFINQVWQLYSLQILSGIADACLMAAYYAIFSHHIDKNSQGFEWSLLSVGGLTISVAIGSLIGGAIAELYGFRAIFIGWGVLNLSAIFLLIIFYPYIKILRKEYHYKTIVHEKRY